ncbi:phosphatidylinositol phosphatase PTPRQ [Polypterus senegalus]|uniref:phosphatidylinositol phosphatase PTPRQ n=1 Tax=Polypterus senegalus TaxID=55291 RepID=UPI0019663C74|nr:phosphatidylinositol phosphatase PTPRQ [Polypterus senegalus]
MSGRVSAGSSSRAMELSVNGVPVERVCSLKYLDMYITKDLTWTQHTQTQLLYRLPANNKTLYVTRVTGNRTQIKNLYPGSDYVFEIQSLSASESSMAVSKLFTARPPGVISLSVSSVSTCTAEIIWKSSSGIFDHYKVTVSNSTFLRELTVAKLWLNFTATDLFPGCTYNFTVSRVRKNIEGTSAVVTIVADPEKPQEVEVVNVTSNSFSIHWIAPPGHVDRYHVVVSPSREDVTVKDLGSNRIQATVTNAVPGQNYTITVSAVSSSSFSSHVVKYVTTYETPPSQPLSVEGEGVGNIAILLSWTPSKFSNGEIISHVIYFREVCPWSETSFKDVLSYSSSPEYLLSNLNAGSTYEIKVAAQNSAGTGNFSYPIFFKTEDSAPGQVSNLIAFTYNHTMVNVKWFLPKRPNGRITKFVVNTKLARSGQQVKSIEISADEVLKDGVPECFNNSELYSRTTFSPTSSQPVSAIPFGFAWSVPISVVVDQLKPYTSYVFEVFPYTKDYEGQVSTALVRMPESVPEDAPQNLAKGNITSKSFSVFWDSPTIVTGKFSYKVELYGPSGRIFENITRDLRFSYFGLTPYTMYTVFVGAETVAGLGPKSNISIFTPAEAPGPVSDLKVKLVGSTSVTLSWKTPLQQNGIITQYKILVLKMNQGTVFQNIVISRKEKEANGSMLLSDGMLTEPFEGSADTSRLPANTVTLPASPAVRLAAFTNKLSTSSEDNSKSTLSDISQVLLTSPLPQSSFLVTNSKKVSTNNMLSLPYTGNDAAHLLQGNGADSGYSYTLPVPQRVKRSVVSVVTTDGTVYRSPTQPPLSSRAASAFPNVIEETTTFQTADLSIEEMSYIVTNLLPYTDYTFNVSASTAVGEGPQASIAVKTKEQVPGSVQDVTYQNITSSSVLVSWKAPYRPNGRITHYTVYGMDLFTNEAFQKSTNETSIILSGLKKYGLYKLRVAASTAAGESSLSEQDDVFVRTLEDEPESPPQNITLKNVTATSANLHWSPPDKPNGIIQYYEAIYVSKTGMFKLNTSLTNIILQNLKPYTVYNFSVKAYTRYGHGNQSSSVFTVLTDESVPDSAPENITFKVLSSTTMQILFLPPRLPNGIIRKYTIFLTPQNETAMQIVNTTFLANNITGLRKYTNYTIQLSASTSKGEGVRSKNATVLTGEDVPSSPPRALSIKHMPDSVVKLSWKPPLHPNGEIQYYTIHVWSGTTEIVQNVSNMSVLLDDLESNSEYHAYVTSSTRLGDGGVKSEVVVFRTSEGAPADPPGNLSYVNISSTSIEVLWMPPSKPNGIIQFYTVYYSNSSGNIYSQNVTDIDFENVNENQTYSTIINDMMKYSYYNLWMTASTALGDGNQTSTILAVHTDEDVPDDTIQNLIYQNVSSTAVNISWLPPTSPNGKVFYFVSLWKPGMSTFLINSTSTKMYITIENLEKYTDYILKITPATGAGFLENSTVSLQFKTDEDAPGTPPKFIKYKNLTASSIELFWEPPDQPNGIITSYDINFQGPANSHTFSTANMSHVLFNLIPYTLYNLSISARTRKGSGPFTTQLVHTDETEPSAPPQNLSVISCTAESVWLMWNPSLKPNGFVRVYSFKIFNNQSQLVSYQNSSAQFMEANLTGLQPFSQYQISVSAFTRLGNGNLFSNTVSFTTKQSVPDIVQNLLCSGTSWQSVLVQWDAPAKPNGVITHYVVQFGNEIMEFQPTDRVHTFRDLLANASYTYYVMASTVVGRGKRLSCVAKTLQESVPSAPLNIKVKAIHPTNVTLGWTRPEQVPGNLLNYQIVGQMLSLLCNDWIRKECLEKEINQFVYGDGNELEATIYSLMKFRDYRFTVAATTSAGYGNSSEWVYTKTEIGDPDEPPENVIVVSSSFNSINISWEPPRVITGPTSYLVDIFSLDTQDYNETFTKKPEEARLLFVSNLTAFTTYGVRITAYTGKDHDARIHGKACPLVIVTTMEDKPKDPPKNISFQKLPEDVTKVYITFSPPSEPNGNIIMYQATVEKDGDFSTQIHNLQIVENKNQSLTAVIEGLKGGYTYRISVYAVNGAGSGPKIQLNITTNIQAPPQPNKKPEAFEQNGALLISSTTITIKTPQCFFSDAHGPIRHIQVIVSESGVKNDINISTWKEAFFKKPRPYFTNEGFPNPQCSDGRKNPFSDETYTIGAEESCMLPENEQEICNGPLKPGKQYVFKFRATNIKGQYTDSEFSNPVKTLGKGMSDQAVEITLAVTLCVLSIILLVAAIYAFARIRQKQKEGGTYSPRDAEIIDTKFKLDQLITVADLELKEEKLTRLLSYRKSLKPVNKKSFLQHLEELCANNNFKFQEEFSELPKLLQDLATTDADLPWNRSKNRFTNIKPYNNNRVKLMSEPGVPGSDYINASYVSGYLCPNEFIATQGPLPGTVADFWRMIWETRTRTIVMLTQCFEKGRIRCHQYWPEDNKPVTVFGDIVITKLTENVQPDWTVRDLKVEKHGDYMVVRHFNFTSWPEHGVPESSTAIIHFVKLIRAIRAHENTTIAVHCSAGVGRTGVFIALDHLLQHVSDHDFVDIYGLVAELRRERMCMVQNLAQYMFLHQCALDLLSSKGNSQSVWFVNYSALEKMDSLDAMEGDVELEWEETTM